MGPSPFSSNTQFRHFCHIIIVVQCPNTWARVQSVQIPDSDISAQLSLLHSVPTHWPKSNQYTNTRFRHFCPIIIVAQCLDTLVGVQLIQIPELNILSSSDLLFSVRTHWPESIRFKYRILTFLPDYNCCTVSGHIGPSTIGTNTRIKHFSILRIVVQCPDRLARV